MIGLLRGGRLLLGRFVVCFVESQRKTLIIFFGTISLCRTCGVLFCRSLVIAMLAKGVFERRSRSSSSICLLERKTIFGGLCGCVQ